MDASTQGSTEDIRICSKMDAGIGGMANLHGYKFKQKDGRKQRKSRQRNYKMKLGVNFSMKDDSLVYPIGHPTKFDFAVSRLTREDATLHFTRLL